jgi:hypothetical protein
MQGLGLKAQQVCLLSSTFLYCRGTALLLPSRHLPFQGMFTGFYNHWMGPRMFGAGSGQADSIADVTTTLELLTYFQMEVRKKDGRVADGEELTSISPGVLSLG